DLRAHIIREAEEIIGYRWPRFKASDYADYYRNGSRKSYDEVFKAVFDPLTKLAVAECVEGKGRFLDDIANGIWARCEDTSWVHTGHLQHYGEETIPIPDGEYMDLRCCSTGMQLAMIHRLLGSRLREWSPVLTDRIEKEIKVRILDRYIKTDQWWTNFEEGHTINNWNTHCNKCVIVTALIIEKDRDRLLTIMEKACRSLDIFLSIYHEDGACNEGPGYWKGASLVFLGSLHLIADIYGTDLNEVVDNRIRNMGNYIYKVLIYEDWYMGYADGNGRNPMYDAKLFITGDFLGDRRMMNMALDVFKRNEARGVFYENFIYDIYDYLEYITAYSKLKEKSCDATDRSYYLKNAVLADSHIFAARMEEGSEKGFFIGIKGGNNDESHNHNDMGCPYVYYNGEPVIIDVGAGMYTIKTFSPERYDIWTMQSGWHSLPELNGYPQSAGENFRSEDFEWKDDGTVASASMDVSQAYPDEADVSLFKRSISLDRGLGAVTLEDRVVLNSLKGESVFHITLKDRPFIIEAGLVGIKNRDGLIKLTYDSSLLECSIEEKSLLDDEKLFDSWGSMIHRFNFKPLKQSREYLLRFGISLERENQNEQQ
ncbi:MAG: heparinase II/III family protein, partial [Clostridia bacterium]|nr:heparinase II/III family protein [Clostridia bacterium]